VKLALQLVAGNPISAIGLPALAEIQDNPVRLHAGVLRSLTIICAVCSPIFFGASAVAGESIIVVFGPHWVGAVPVMQLLSFSGLAMVLITFNDNVFLLKDRPIWCLLVSLSYATLAVTALLTLSHFHITSLALPFVLPYCAVLPFSIMLMSKLVDLHLRDVVAATFPGLSTSLVMFAGVHWAAGHLPACAHIIRLAVLCAFGAVIYSTGLICMWRSTAMLLLGMLRHLRPGRMVKNLVL
jgi:O-antigen/teichoic acid export membrane protein